MVETTKGAIKNQTSRDNGYIVRHKTQDEDKQNTTHSTQKTKQITISSNTEPTKTHIAIHKMTDKDFFLLKRRYLTKYTWRASGINVRRYDGQKVYFSLSMTTKTHLIKGKALLTIGYTIFGNNSYSYIHSQISFHRKHEIIEQSGI